MTGRDRSARVPGLVALWVLVSLPAGGVAHAELPTAATLAEVYSAAAAPDASARVRIESLRALRAHGISAPGVLSAVFAATLPDLRHALWRLEAASSPDAIRAIVAERRPGGGFGLLPGHAASAEITAEALLAFAAAGVPVAEVERDLVALVSLQQPDGGWSVGHEASDLPTTALALRALAAWRRVAPLDPYLAAGVAWLALPRPSARPVLDLALRADALAVVDALDEPSLLALVAAGAGGRWFDAQGTAAAARVLARARPNLRVAEALVSDPAPPEGAVVTVRARIHNAGLWTADAYTVGFTDGAATRTEALDALGAGESAWLEWSVPTAGRLGGITTRITADLHGAVDESDESDNTREVRIRVRAARPADLELRPEWVLVAPPTPAEDAPFALQARVRNVGDSPAPAASVIFALGDPTLGAPVLGRAPVPPLDPGAIHFAEIDAPGLASARHRVMAVLEQPAPDGFAGNDRASRVVRVVQGANLRIIAGGVSLEPGPLVGLDAPLTVRARVINDGTVASPASAVSVRGVGRPELDRVPLPPLAPGAAAEVTLTVRLAEAGVWHLLAQADPDDALVEPDEVDNLATFAVSVIPVDLVAGDFLVSPASDPDTGLVPPRLHAGYFGRAAVTVRNLGAMEADSFAVEVRADSPEGPVLGRRAGLRVAAAPVGGSAQVGLTLTVSTRGLTPGEHTLYLVVDSDNDWPEVDETNNVGTTTIRVYEPLDLAALSLAFDPPNPSPGAPVTVRWTTRRPADFPPNLNLTTRVDTGVDRVMHAHGIATTGQFSWVAPERPGDHEFVLRIDPEAFHADVNPENNTLVETLRVGPPAAIIRLTALDEAVVGRPVRLRAEVDGAVDVSFGEETRTATPLAPAEFEWIPDAPGMAHLSFEVLGGSAALAVDVRADAETPAAPTLAAVAGGVEATLTPVAGASAYLLLRDEQPVATSAVIDAALPPLPWAGERTTRLVTLAAPGWVTAVDIAGADAFFAVRWRLDAWRGDRWETVYAEMTPRGIGALRRIELPPVHTDRLRWVVDDAPRQVPGFVTRLEVVAAQPDAALVRLDARAPGVAQYRVIAYDAAGLPGPTSPAAEVAHPVPAGELEVSVEDGVADLRWVAPPGERAFGHLIEIDGEGQSAVVQLGDAVPDFVVGGAPAFPWSFSQAQTRIAGRWRLPSPRPIERVEVEASAGLEFGRFASLSGLDADETEFAPGVVSSLRFVAPWPLSAMQGALVNGVRLWGPPIHPLDGEFSVPLSAGAHTVSLIALDHHGRRGPPRTLPIEVPPPAPVTDLVAELLPRPGRLPAVVLTWQAPPETAGVAIHRDDMPIIELPGHARQWLDDALEVAGGTYRVFALDAAGNPSAPAEITVIPDALGPGPRPDVTVDGFIVSATWPEAAPRAISGWRVFLDGAPLEWVASPQWDGLVATPGVHTLSVAEYVIDGGGRRVTGPPGPPVAFQIADDGAPAAPTFRPPADWSWGESGLLVRWHAPPVPDVVRYQLWINDEPEPRVVTWRPGQAPEAAVGHRRGVHALRLELAAIDAAGHVSPRSRVDFPVPAAPAPTLSLLSLNEGRIWLSEPPTRDSIHGYFLYRDGARLCRWLRHGADVPGIAAASSGPEPMPGLFRVPAEGLWRPVGGDAEPWVGLAPPLPCGFGIPESLCGVVVDRVTVNFAAVETRAIDYDIEVRDQVGAWRSVLAVRGNAEARRIHALPEIPRAAGTGIRVRATRSGPDGLLVSQLGFETCDARGISPLDATGGRQVFTARGWSAAGDAGPLGPGLIVDVPLVDAAVDPHGIVISDDEPTVGETITLLVPIQNLGSGVLDAVEVELRFIPPDGAPPPAPQRAIAGPIAAGGEGAVAFGWPVTTVGGDFNVVLDPDNRLIELRKQNNHATAPLLSDLPFRTQGFTMDGLTVIGTAPDALLEVRGPDRGLLLRRRIGEDEVVTLRPPIPAGEIGVVVTLGSDRPFIALAGSLQASAFHARDAFGEGLSTRHVTPFPRSTLSPVGQAEELDRLVILSPGRPTSVVISELATGVVLAGGEVPADRPTAFDVQTADHTVQYLVIEADAPVIAWAYADLGFKLVAPDGRHTGTELYGFVGRASGRVGAAAEEIAVWSFGPDTRVLIERLDTGEVLWEGTLPRYAVRSALIPLPADDIIPIRVRASDEIAAASTSLLTEVAYGYIHGFMAPAEGGRLIGHRFVVPMPPNGRADARIAAFGFYDGITVRVRDADSLQEIFAARIDRGQSLDIGRRIHLEDRGERRRLLVESDGPISIYTGIGAAAAAQLPLLYGAPADLTFGEIAAPPVDPDDPQALTTVTAVVRNAGMLRARRVDVHVYAGDPADGVRIHAQRFERIDGGREAALTVDLGGAAGITALTFVVDPDDTVRESDEQNNRARYVLGTPPDPLPVAIAANPAVGQIGDLRVTVRNDGGQAVNGVPIRVTLDDDALLGATRVDLPADAEATVTLPWRPTHAGPTTVVVELDPAHERPDFRRDNNRLAQDFEVAPADASLHLHADGPVAPIYPHEDVSVQVRLEPAREDVTLRLIDPEGQPIASTHPQGDRAELIWTGERPIGQHTLRVEAIPEGGGPALATTAVEVHVIPYRFALHVEAPAELQHGFPLALRVTPDEALPPGATLTAPGFDARPAAGLAAVELPRRDPLPLGPHRFPVTAVLANRPVGQGHADVEVIDASAEVQLRLNPAVAGPGVPVEIRVHVQGHGDLRLSLEGEPLSEHTLNGPSEEIAGIADPLEPGRYRITADLRREDQIVAQATADFERLPADPAGGVHVQLDDAFAVIGDPIQIEVRLRAHRTPTRVDRLTVLITDDPPRVVAAEHQRPQSPRGPDDPDELPAQIGPAPARAVPLEIPTEGLRPRAQRHRLIVHAERRDLLTLRDAQGQLQQREHHTTVGVGTATLRLQGPDGGLPEEPDAELPDAELPDAQIPDAQLPDPPLLDAEIPDAQLPDAEPLPDPRHDGGDALTPPVDQGHEPDQAPEDAQPGDAQPGDAQPIDAQPEDAQPDPDLPDLQPPPDATIDGPPPVHPTQDARRPAPPTPDAATDAAPGADARTGSNQGAADGCDCRAADAPSLPLLPLLLFPLLARRRRS